MICKNEERGLRSFYLLQIIKLFWPEKPNGFGILSPTILNESSAICSYDKNSFWIEGQNSDRRNWWISKKIISPISISICWILLLLFFNFSGRNFSWEFRSQKQPVLTFSVRSSLIKTIDVFSLFWGQSYFFLFWAIFRKLI